MNKNEQKNQLRYLAPDNLYEQLHHFTKGMAVTRDSFEMNINNCTLEDLEWNHMDQLHRSSIHHTYEKGIRIATGQNFAVSLTEWKRWPLLITVTDVYVKKGLFYQSLTIAGMIFVHSIISMEESADGVTLKDEWFIASRKWLKFLHKPLNKKLHKLNARLQDEDAQIRHGRFGLRKKGYHFKTDAPNYYTSNVLGNNTIYPSLNSDASLDVREIGLEPTCIQLGELDFIVQKSNADEIMIWPAACPHEGGPLLKGNFCEKKISCPWHGLQFSAVCLSSDSPYGSRYGFEYHLADGFIHIRQSQPHNMKVQPIFDESINMV